MSFFDKIANLISEKENEPESDGLKENSSPLNEKTGSDQNEESPDDTTHSQESSSQGHNVKEKKQETPSLETREELIQNLCDLSCELFDNVELSAGKRLVVWLDTNQLTFKTYNTDQYRQRVMAALVNECDVKFDTVAFNVGKPAEELRCTPVGKSGKIFMQVVEKQPAQTSTSGKAIISIFGNAGSLLKDEYVLSSDEMKAKRISVYNIGAGEFPQVPTGYRENHIAIDDNPDSPMVEKNKFVSRMHAHIGYSETFGFYLQAELDGTRLMGKRTRIFRGEQKIEMDNPQVKEPLQDGDLIELGKAVVLRYVEIND